MVDAGGGGLGCGRGERGRVQGRHLPVPHRLHQGSPFLISLPINVILLYSPKGIQARVHAPVMMPAYSSPFQQKTLSETNH